MKSLRGKVIYSFSILITLTVLLMASMSYYIASQYIKDSVGELAKNVAHSTSKDLNLNYHKKILADINAGKSAEYIIQTDEYIQMRKDLYNVKKLTGIKYIYTMAKNKDGQFVYMVDGFPIDYRGDDISMPGEIETIDYVYMKKTFDSGKLHVGQMSYDETWGANITTYIPLISTNGQMLGLLGIDFEASEVFQLLDHLKTFFILIGIIVLIFSFILCYALASILVNPLKKLTDTILNCKGDDLPSKIDITGSYEVEKLSSAFSNMLTKLNKTLENVNYIANHDSLTGLYNRRYFESQFKATVENEKIQSALCFIDLDEFKQINDKYGHDIGDKVLQTSARRIRSVVAEKGFAGRMGGDEFVVCLTDFENIDESKSLFSNILKELNKPIYINKDMDELSCHASLGITYCPKHSNKVETLMKYADMAMYLAKEKGKNNIIVYESTIEKVIS